jgi:putative acyl-CoA dehydrogenase
LVLQEIAQATSDDRRLEAALDRVASLLHEPRLLDVRARELVETLALTAAVAILRIHGHPDVADAFIATRLAGPPRQSYGQGLEFANTAAILSRVLP